MPKRKKSPEVLIKTNTKPDGPIDPARCNKCGRELGIGWPVIEGSDCILLGCFSCGTGTVYKPG